MRRHDKRTREQRKADESALFAAACLGATILLVVISILATSAQAVDAIPEESSEVAEEYDPAWDIPATESAVCNDVFLGEFTLTAYCPGRCCCGKWASGYAGDRGTHDRGRPEGDPLRHARPADLAGRHAAQLHRGGLRRWRKR